jgi:hypothetical protein
MSGWRERSQDQSSMSYRGGRGGLCALGPQRPPQPPAQHEALAIFLVTPAVCGTSNKPTQFNQRYNTGDSYARGNRPVQTSIFSALHRWVSTPATQCLFT